MPARQLLHRGGNARSERRGADLDREVERTGVDDVDEHEPEFAGLTRVGVMPDDDILCGGRATGAAWCRPDARRDLRWRAVADREEHERRKGNQSDARSLGVSPSFCAAVGVRRSGGHSESLVGQWNGRRWTTRDGRNPGALNLLNGVSCTTAKFCVAVGNQARGAGTWTLVEQWNGRGWRTVRRLEPELAQLPLGVSCTRSRSCRAVGDLQSGVVDQTLVEKWNGIRWLTAGSADPTSRDGFNGVSCSAGTSCKPVGYEIVNASTFDSLIEWGA